MQRVTFKFENYCDSAVNLIIITTAKALNLNLSIYQKGPDGNIQVLEQTTDIRGREVHLKFIWDPNNPTNNHYDAILLFDKPGQVCHQDKDNFVSPKPIGFQTMMQGDADEVTDLTDDSKTTFIHV